MNWLPGLQQIRAKANQNQSTVLACFDRKTFAATGEGLFYKNCIHNKLHVLGARFAADCVEKSLQYIKNCYVL